MKPPEEIAREIANGAVKFDWNTGSAGFHTRRAMIQTYIFNVPVRLIPGENEDVVVAKFEKWAEPIRGRIATTLAVLVRAAISAERSAGLSDGGKDRKATAELSDAPKAAPSSGCHNDKPGDPCPCGANFERCPPAGTPPDGIVNDAPAPDAPCDFCLGRREVQKMGLCPQCRGSST